MSELALKLIAENKKTKSPFLDLGNCGLTEVPEEIGELIWLEELSFASEWTYFDGGKWVTKNTQNKGGINNLTRLTPAIFDKQDISSDKFLNLNPFSKLIKLKKLYLRSARANSKALSDLSPISSLRNLQHLDVSQTQITDLSPLSDLINLQQLIILETQVTDLSPLSVLVNLQQLNVLYTPIRELTALSSLTKLQDLNISETLITDLSPLSSLINLRKLDISKTRVTDLSPLSVLLNIQDFNVSSTPVIDLSPLSNFTNLQDINISYTQVSDMSPLAGLMNLQRLNVSSTQVVDLSPLSGLVNLQHLEIWRTKVTNLFPLSSLSNIQRLNISHTHVTDLAPLSGFANLQWLNVSETQVTDLSPLLELIKNDLRVRWSWSSRTGHGIYIDNCPLTNPPVEIVKQGNTAVLNYFHEKAIQGIDRLYEAKMLIIGEGGAGKTSLLRRLYQIKKSLPDENETTKGIDIYKHEFALPNDRRFRLNVWDFGGQEIYHATHQFFLTKRSLYVLVDDTRRDSKTIHDKGFSYWLEIVDLLSSHSPVLIFQNEKGGRSKNIDLAGIKGRYDNVMELYSGNLEHSGAADNLRWAIEFYVQNLPHIGEELPAKWIEIRADIEKHAAHRPYISLQDYFAIYQKHLELNREKALHLSRYLHDLGVFLHFQDEPLLARTVILQNTWATEAVFKMLDDETVKGRLGRFDNTDCQRVWSNSLYADMHPELLALMQKFELCYKLKDTQKGNDEWLAPQLLPPSKPTTLTDWHQTEDLTLRYRYEFLPKGIISRLIVRMHRFVKCPDLSWISGALFERDDTQVLVEVPDKGGEIVLRARGAERKELLSIISADLDALNEQFHGLKELVGKWVPCLCNRCRTLAEPEFFAQKRLLQRKKDNKLKIECPASYEDVDVLELLDGIRVDQLPGWAKEENTPKPQSKEPELEKRTIKIFLASSAELKEDRDAFELYFRQQNDDLREKGIYLKIVRWENFLDALSETRLQDEYNKEIKACDIFVSLFFTKTGKFTEEEFNIAHEQFKATKKPLIYTFFKNGSQNMNDIGDEIISLLTFKKKLSALGHFYTSYDNIEHLKRQFKDQLEKMQGSEI